MLVLSRKIGEKLVIGDNITVVVSRVAGNRVMLGIEAPHDVRIVAVADVFDALLNVRHYKPAWGLDDALKLLRGERGLHFDPACVNALLRRLDEAMDIQKQYGEVTATTPPAGVQRAAPMNP